MEELRSSCQICGRDIYYTEANGYWKHSGTNVPRHIPQVPPQFEKPKVKSLGERVREQEDCLRELACYLGVGGYNDCNLTNFDPQVYLAKIKQGISDYIESEIKKMNTTHFDIESLRAETKAAIVRGKEIQQQKEIEDSNKEKNRHAQAKAWAEAKILEVPFLCKMAASKGKNTVAVTCNTSTGKPDRHEEYDSTLAARDFTFKEYWNTKGEGLKYYYLHGMLEDLGLNVKVVYEWEGGGMYSWRTIYVSW